VAEQLLELEGTWEEILGRAGQLAGRRVRLIVLPEIRQDVPEDGPPGPDHAAMLQLLEEWQQTPLTDEEQAILEGFDEFRREHPFRLRQLKDRS
jgi:hypothetical protein